jgi:hypothetical protein
MNRLYSCFTSIHLPAVQLAFWLTLLLCLGSVSVRAAVGQVDFFTYNPDTSFGQVYLPATTTAVGPEFSGQLMFRSHLINA